MGGCACWLERAWGWPPGPRREGRHPGWGAANQEPAPRGCRMGRPRGWRETHFCLGEGEVGLGLLQVATCGSPSIRASAQLVRFVFNGRKGSSPPWACLGVPPAGRLGEWMPHPPAALPRGRHRLHSTGEETEPRRGEVACPSHTAGRDRARCQPSGPRLHPQPGRSPYLLWVEEDVSQALQAQHADLGAGVPEALGQHRQGCLFGEHFQQGRAVEELGSPRAGGSGRAPSRREPHLIWGPGSRPRARAGGFGEGG